MLTEDQIKLFEKALNQYNDEKKVWGEPEYHDYYMYWYGKFQQTVLMLHTLGYYALLDIETDYYTIIKKEG